MNEQMFLEEKKKIEDLTEKIIREAIENKISIIGFKSIVITLTKYLLDLENTTIEEYIETLNTFAEENYF